MSQDDVFYIIEIFKKLKKWRDELRELEHEAMLRGAVVPQEIEAVRVH